MKYILLIIITRRSPELFPGTATTSQR